MLSDAHMGLLLPAKKILDNKEAEGTPLRHTVKLEFFSLLHSVSFTFFMGPTS